MKQRVITIPCNANATIRLSERAADASHIELDIGRGAEIICIDDRAFSAESVDFSLNCTVQKNAQLLYFDQRIFVDQAQVASEIALTAERDSVIRFEQWQHGGQKIRTVIDAFLIGECSEIDIRLGAQLAGNQKHEINTKQYHQAAYTKSNCTMKVIVSESARSLYDGMIQIDTSAQKSEAFQEHKALLMSDAAYAYAQPSLQVRADDVQCGHGSAIGQLDAEQLDYLQARGIGQVRAQELLLHAFMDDLYSSDFSPPFVLSLSKDTNGSRK